MKNPFLSAVYNDGEIDWEQDQDGPSHSPSLSIGCKIQTKFINKSPLHISVSFSPKKLAIMYFSESNQKWYNCVNASISPPSSLLSSSSYFGFTASTGSVSDFHDLLSFELYEMDEKVLL
jgi:hypothetical protein